MIRIIIADDHHLIRRGFKQYIDRATGMTLLDEAETGMQLLELCRSVSCDVVLLDIGLPDKNGLDVLKELKGISPKTKVLVLSMHPEQRYAKRALQNGASGYISKGSPPEELERAIRKVAEGGRYISETLAEELASDFRGGKAEAPHLRLSNREFQILILLGEGDTIKTIAGKLNLSVSTVHTYKQRIMEKLSLETTFELMQYVLNEDLIHS